MQAEYARATCHVRAAVASCLKEVSAVVRTTACPRCLALTVGYMSVDLDDGDDGETDAFHAMRSRLSPGSSDASARPFFDFLRAWQDEHGLAQGDAALYWEPRERNTASEIMPKSVVPSKKELLKNSFVVATGRRLNAEAKVVALNAKAKLAR